MRIVISTILSFLLITAATAANFVLSSPDFHDKGTIPDIYSCDGKNISPSLKWENPPKNTDAFALVLSVPDAPGGVFYSWILFNIPGDQKFLEEGADENLPEGILVGNTSIGDDIYRGPCPPDNIKHHYLFTLYALDAKLNLSSGADIDDVLMHIRRHTLGQATLTGVFKH
ncbi:MAG: YbhB/YbcL family Raf kinase inhibitor-like protein [Gammaproteobacteria bacterium]